MSKRPRKNGKQASKKKPVTKKAGDYSYDNVEKALRLQKEFYVDGEVRYLPQTLFVHRPTRTSDELLDLQARYTQAGLMLLDKENKLENKEIDRSFIITRETENGDSITLIAISGVVVKANCGEISIDEERLVGCHEDFLEKIGNHEVVTDITLASPFVFDPSNMNRRSYFADSITLPTNRFQGFDRKSGDIYLGQTVTILIEVNPKDIVNNIGDWYVMDSQYLYTDMRGKNGAVSRNLIKNTLDDTWLVGSEKGYVDIATSEEYQKAATNILDRDVELNIVD